MLTKTPAPKSIKGVKIKTATLVKPAIESKADNEKQLIETINADFKKKREDISKKLNLKEARIYLEKQRQSYDAFLNQFDKKNEHLDSIKAALKKEIKKNTLKQFPEFKELMRLDSLHANRLETALNTASLIGDFNNGLMVDPEVVISDYDYEIVEPPYDLFDSELNVGGDFDEDSSFPWHDWGTLTNYVRYRHEHSWTEGTTHSHKYASSSVSLGINYKMPRHGSLDITVVLKNLNNQVAYGFTDNIGPSYAKFNIENTIFIPVSSGGTRRYIHSATMFNETRKSEGGESSNSIFPVATDTPSFINFRTEHIHEGEDLQIMIASWLRVYSTSFRMRVDLIASLLWKVDKIYLRVVE